MAEQARGDKYSTAGSTARPDLQSTQTMPADHGLLSDWSQTQPTPQVDPNSPGASIPPEAPWGSAHTPDPPASALPRGKPGRLI